LVDRVAASRNGIDNVASKTIKLWIADGILDESAQKRKVVSAERILPPQLPFIKSLRRAKWRAGKSDRPCGMMDYLHVSVASTFSPTFIGVLAEAKRFASHCGADLEIVHAGAFDVEKEKRFLGALGQRAELRWVEGETAAKAIVAAVENFAYQRQ
jgi:hypothetical protein